MDFPEYLWHLRFVAQGDQPLFANEMWLITPDGKIETLERFLKIRQLDPEGMTYEILSFEPYTDERRKQLEEALYGRSA